MIKEGSLEEIHMEISTGSSQGTTASFETARTSVVSPPYCDIDSVESSNNLENDNRTNSISSLPSAETMTDRHRIRKRKSYLHSYTNKS